MAKTKMGLVDYKSQTLIILALPSREYDEIFLVVSVYSSISVLELIDYVILNNLANQN